MPSERVAVTVPVIVSTWPIDSVTAVGWVCANWAGAAGPGTVYDPADVHADGNTLFCVDGRNFRVLQWDQPIDFSIQEGPDAQRVLGQPDLFSNATRYPADPNMTPYPHIRFKMKLRSRFLTLSSS